MTNPKGYRRGTRYMFSRKFKDNGRFPITQYLQTYKRGDIVDIVTNGAIHKGMPHKFYHGKTGIVYNVTPRGIGVIINKQVRHRIIKKRINVRVEHIQHSTCRLDFLRRVKENDRLRSEAKAKGVQINLKRTPAQPAKAELVKAKNETIETITPQKYVLIA
eukprot:Clim_evm38s218 gene=Clim_evmTU38s218